MEVVLLMENGNPLLMENGDFLLLYEIFGLLIPETCRGISIEGDGLSFNIVGDPYAPSVTVEINENLSVQVANGETLGIDAEQNENLSLALTTEGYCDVIT